MAKAGFAGNCKALPARIVGVDVSPELVARAREKRGATYLVLSYAELCAEPARAGSDFDTIVCNFSLLDDRLEPLLDALASISAPRGRLLIQTLHPLAMDPPYEDGWRVERFEEFDDEGWTPMPYFVRTLGLWVDAISRKWVLKRLLEPGNPIGADSRIPAAHGGASLIRLIVLRRRSTRVIAP